LISLIKICEWIEPDFRGLPIPVP